MALVSAVVRVREILLRGRSVGRRVRDRCGGLACGDRALRRVIRLLLGRSREVKGNRCGDHENAHAKAKSALAARQFQTHPTDLCTRKLKLSMNGTNKYRDDDASKFSTMI